MEGAVNRQCRPNRSAGKDLLTDVTSPGRRGRCRRGGADRERDYGDVG